MTAMTTQQELVRFLEDRFACAQACTACARACVLRVSRSDPDATDHEALLRRKALLCAEVCDTTCRMLAEQNRQDESALRLQTKWCLLVCLECAQVLDAQPGAEADAETCRECARACTEFMATLN
ncbi:ferredoxin [Streptomyces prunicolor]|uniref:ferredoxin n=1 Tax=Streptomyces prunicolor TaxID=67348 RepID=UPI00371DDCD9